MDIRPLAEVVVKMRQMLQTIDSQKFSKRGAAWKSSAAGTPASVTDSLLSE
jgi:hypothetical protein